MRRGDVYWVRFPPPAGRRPAVLVSRDEAYAVRSRVTVVPIVRNVRGIATEVRLGPSDGLPKVSVANADEIVTVPPAILDGRITTLMHSKIDALDEALRFALALDATRTPR